MRYAYKVDGSGRALMGEDSGTRCSSSATVDVTEGGTKSQPVTTLLGPFVAHRILGEDRSEM